MVAGSSVQKGAPEAFATQAGDAADRIQGMLTTLMAGLQNLEGSWKGSGGTTFIQVKQTVNEQTAKLYNALHGMGSDIGIAGAAYENADQLAQQEMAKANSGITAVIIPQKS